MFCNNCGKMIPDGTAFCTECGSAVAAETKNDANNVNSASGEEQKSAGNTPYNNVVHNYYQMQRQPVSVAGWIGRSLIPMIPLLGPIIYFIMLFVWSGDNSKEESFKNWAKAQLVVMLIGVILSLVVILPIVFMLINMYGHATYYSMM